jgi:biotin synthase
MRIDWDVERILDRAQAGEDLTRDDALGLMGVDLDSPEMYLLWAVADRMTRQHCDNSGDVFAQIGLDYDRCPERCQFCMFGTGEIPDAKRVLLGLDDVVERAVRSEQEGANAVYLMTTASYDFRRFLQIGRAVRVALSPEMPLVANIGDFSPRQARELQEAGFCAVYHAVRVREGRDSRIPVARRLASIRHAQEAGLAVHFCVEPVGPEHRAEELVNLMFLGRELGVAWSGAMRRVNVPGSPLKKHGELPWRELARVVAVCRLVMGRACHAHCTHEPNLPALLAGANILWAEVGPNPRDPTAETEASRGISVSDCRAMLVDAGYRPRQGPSPNVWPPERELAHVWA